MYEYYEVDKCYYVCVLLYDGVEFKNKKEDVISVLV